MHWFGVMPYTTCLFSQVPETSKERGVVTYEPKNAYSYTNYTKPDQRAEPLQSDRNSVITRHHSERWLFDRPHVQTQHVVLLPYKTSMCIVKRNAPLPFVP